ncbi:unnamed protein product [Adineta steineri]|uniref:Uncharacterized protein n=1 Tax=Adineta steineri TaxID=433720 RepID=A0A814D1A4_9BILA|nr:unnamed protein product [Adineta steineri]
MRVQQPSLIQFEQLYFEHAPTLKCPCTQISINYDNFISIEYSLHQVCNSIFVNDEWIYYLTTTNGTILYGDDFRVTGPYAFQALRMFCELATNTIASNLVQFYSSQYISGYVTPSAVFQAQVESKVSQFLSSMADSFLVSLKMIRETTQVNALFSGLQTNYQLYSSTGSGNVFVTAKTYDGCSCSLSSTCTHQSSIYGYNTTKILFNVTGFYTGCNVIESLLQSNLECFYNQTCINGLQKYLLTSPMYVSALGSSLYSRYLETTIINDLLDNLMVEQWSFNSSYSKCYAACIPEYCSYQTIANNRKHKTIYIVFLVFFILGGPLSVLKLLISMLTKIIICCVRKSPAQVVPEA